MNHRLLVAAKVLREGGISMQRLAEASNISVLLDAEASTEKAGLLAVSFHVLVLEKLDRRLNCYSFGIRRRGPVSPENSPDMLAVEAEFMLNCLLSVN